MLNYRNNVEKNKNLINYSECKKLIFAHDIIKIGEGYQGSIFKAVSDKCGSVVIKLYRDNNITKKSAGYNTYNKMMLEYKTLLKLKKLIDDKVCPNYINIIDFIQKKQYIVLEYADGDSTYIFKNNVSFEIMESFLIQTLVGLLCFHKIIKMWHNDLKLENILYKKINKNIVINYSINDINYLVPTHGYLFMLSDFGISMDIDYATHKNKALSEFTEIDILKKSIDMMIMTKIINKINTLEDIKIFLRKSNYEMIEEIMKKKDKIEESIFTKKMLENIKNEFFTIPIFNDEELIKTGLGDLVKIKNILYDKNTILNIIKKYFSKYAVNNEYTIKDNYSDNIVTFVIKYD